MKIGLFYGSSTCYTEMVAEKIQEIIGKEIVTLHNVNSLLPEVSDSQMNHESNKQAVQQEAQNNLQLLIAQYDLIIMGISTWDYGQLQEDWLAMEDLLASLQLHGKLVALFGLGDQIGYGQWYLDAMGILYEQLQSTGASFLGYWKKEDRYQFEASKAYQSDGDYFVGLALDEDNQQELTQERLEQWSTQLLTEYQQRLLKN